MAHLIPTSLTLALLLAATPAAHGATPATHNFDLTIGRAALEDELYDVAERRLRGVLDSGTVPESERVEIGLLLVRALHGQSRYADMLEVLAELTPPKADGAHIFWTAVARFKTGQSIAAAELLDEFEEQFAEHPIRPDALRLHARCHAHVNAFEKAIAVFEQFERDYPSSRHIPANRLDLAMALLATDRVDDAKRVLSALAKDNTPGRIRMEARHWLGQIGIQQQDWASAEQHLNALTQDDDTPADLKSKAWASLAELHEARNDIDASIDALQHAQEFAPDDAARERMQVVLGQMLLQSGRLEEGVARLKTFIKDSTDDPLAAVLQLNLAHALLDAGHHEQAAAEFQHYLETFSDDAGTPRAHEGRGWALFNLGGRYAEAAAQFEKAYALSESDTHKKRNLIKIGDSYFHNDQYSLATESYGRFLESYPDAEQTPEVAYQIAECRIHAGSTNEADSALIELSNSYTNSRYAVLALIRVAELRRAQRRPFEAINLYNRVLESTTNTTIAAQALEQRGLTSYRLYRFQDALDDFTQVRESYPDSGHSDMAAYMSGRCHYMLSQHEDALRAWTSVGRRDSKSKWAPLAWFRIANHNWNQGRYVDAETNFLAIVDSYPDDAVAPHALLWAGRASLKREDLQRAIGHFTKLARRYPQNEELLPEARFLQAEAKIIQGNFSDAILIYDEIINKYPDHPLRTRAWRRKGNCQFSLGSSDQARFDEAVSSYQVVMADSSAPLDLALHAEYMIGRCMEQMQKRSDAFEQYYKVIVRFFDARAGGVWPNDEAKRWFTRAAFNAVDLLTQQGKWRRAVRILQRVVDAAVPASAEAQKRIERIRAKRWWMS